jgi:hypothetical protein
MIRTKLRSSFLVATLFLSGVAWSAPLSGLYEVEVPVADQAAENRPAALTEALRQVVVKVSGRAAAENAMAVREAMKKPAPYVQQYSYHSNAGVGTEQPLLMSVAFDKSRIDQLLQTAGLPQWSTARPLTIVWLAVEQGNQRILVGAGDRGLVKELLTKAAQRRGLPLRLPLLDATDQARVQAGDAWSDFHDSIIQASLRYEAQAVLVGRLGQSGGRWQVRWTLYQGGASQRWNQTSDKVEALVAYGIDMGTDTLATADVRAVAEVTGGNEVHWVVKDVQDMRSHRRVMDYLASLSGVASVQPEQVNSDSVRLRITSSSGAAALQQQLAFDNRLLALDAGIVAAPGSTELGQAGDQFFRLAP